MLFYWPLAKISLDFVGYSLALGFLAFAALYCFGFCWCACCCGRSGMRRRAKRKADELELSPWTAAEQPDADFTLDVSGTQLHVPRQLLSMCSPVGSALDKDATTMPVLGFEASHVSSFLKLIHPGLFMELSPEIIMETAPVAHYFQVFAVLERFVLWLTRFNEVDEPPDDGLRRL